MSRTNNNQWGYLAAPIFHTTVAQHLARGPVVVAKIQIKNLGWIDEQFGEFAADEAIEAVRNSLRAIPYRVILGGISPSMYGILVTGKITSEVLARDLDDLIAQINYQFGRRFLIELAIGIVDADPRVSRDEKYWVSLANVALSESARTAQPEIFRPEMQLRQEIRNIVGRWTARQSPPSGMYWVYQRVVNADKLDTAGFEALVRWEIDGIGPVAPDVFIPIVESIGVIHLIDKWTVERVIADANKLLATGGTAIGINISGRTLSERADFADFIAKTLAKKGIEPSRLIVELTETAIIEDLAQVKRQFEKLAKLGVLLSIDDFGKGVTNLFTIASLPVAFIKLDHSLLHLDDAALSASLLSIAANLGDHLGARVLAEGIETEEDLAKIRAAGIPLAQGWLFGRPERITALREK